MSADIPEDILLAAEACLHPAQWNPVTVDIIARALLAERERCAAIATGEVYKERYRTWPFWPVQRDGTRGNRSNESDLVRHADDIATAIRSHPKQPGEA